VKFRYHTRQQEHETGLVLLTGLALPWQYEHL